MAQYVRFKTVLEKTGSDVPQFEVYRNSGHPLKRFVNLRGLYGNVQNQGEFGSCTAFASLQWRGALRRQAKLNWIEPSYFANYYEERVIEGTVNEDSGASITDAVTVLVRYGAMPAKDDPYVPEDFVKDPPNDWIQDLRLKPIQAQRIGIDSALNDTLDALSNGHPVLFGFEVFSELESESVAATGILSMPGPFSQNLGGHAVNAIGYDLDKRMILVLNQWGAEWGIKEPTELRGCFWMPFEYYERYVVEAFVGFPDLNH